VTELALELTRAIDPQLATQPELRYGFLLHDIGKIGVPDAILLKPGPLTEQEMQQLHLHPTLGEHLISSVPYLQGVAREVVAYHHERFDGSGYPWGLAGTAIPLPARIFAVADAFDAITSTRPYQPALTVEAAIAELQRQAGSQFDPQIVDAFIPIAKRHTQPDILTPPLNT
jgi:HD-GYP domain-containing protein (c-di-GMP phosphodiesterase class II)